MGFLTISSADREYGTDSNFTYTAPSNLSNYRKIRLHSAQLYRSFYNVTDGTGTAPPNNRFSFVISSSSSGGTTYDVTIPQGNYTVSTMLGALVSAINAVVAPLTVTMALSTLTSKVTITLSDPTKYIRVLPLGPNVGLNLMLGFSRFNPTAYSLGSVTAPRVMNLQRYLALYLNCSFVTGRSYLSVVKGKANLGGIIPISQEFGQVISYVNYLSDYLDVSSGLISQMNFRITDDFDNEIDLNGTVVNLAFECY